MVAGTRDVPAPVWLSWSSGKDAAFAFEELRRDGRYRVVALLTTTTESFGRVSMHGVRDELVEAQARSLGLPLVKVRIPYPCPNEVYESAMGSVLERARSEGVQHVAFGDLFLDDVREYRERRLASVGMTAVFPLWARPTRPLAEWMIAGGIRARLCCVDPRHVPASWAGRPFDADLLASLPSTVDACGERGEFHTFVSESPSFRTPVRVSVGAIVERDGFVFADLVPD